MLQPPPPPLELHQRIAREFAEAIGWPVEKVEEALTELRTYPNEEPSE